MTDFLEAVDIDPRSFKQEGLPADIKTMSLFLGQGELAFEVATYEARGKIADVPVQEIWSKRKGNRAAPVLCVIFEGERIALCGPTGSKPPVLRTKDKRLVERLCDATLRQPDRHSAIRFLSSALPTIDSELSGIVNQGMLSTHELTHGTKRREDWEDSCRKGSEVLQGALADPEGDRILKSLGFEKEKLDNLSLLLRSDGERTALAVMLDEQETPQGNSGRFGPLSPLSYAISKAEKEKLDWVLLVQKNQQLRLYATKPIGVSRRSRTEAFVECQPALLSEDNAGLLWLLFSAKALVSGGSFEEILSASLDFAGDLADRLKKRIYKEVVPALVDCVVKARNLAKPTKTDLSMMYEMALTILFRLLFIAYAEDRDLLPYRRNQSYRQRSLKSKARELADITTNISANSEGGGVY